MENLFCSADHQLSEQCPDERERHEDKDNPENNQGNPKRKKTRKAVHGCVGGHVTMRVFIAARLSCKKSRIFPRRPLFVRTSLYIRGTFRYAE